MISFEEDLRQTLNRHCAESVSGTPDYLLAELLDGVLKVFNDVLVRRAAYRGETCEYTINAEPERPVYQSPLSEKNREALWVNLGMVFSTGPNSEEACHNLEAVVASMIDGPVMGQNAVSNG